MSFDLITYAMAKAYSDKKGGYTEGVTLTYDGNKEGKDTFLDLNGVNFVRIGKAIDIHKITTVTLGDTEIKASDLEFTSEGGADIVLYSGSEGIYVFTNDGNVPAGTYVLDDNGYVITKVVTETIHPIDPKFLPGVELNLDTYGIGGEILALVSSGGGVNTISNDGKFWADVQTDEPLTLKLTYQEGIVIKINNPSILKSETNNFILQLSFDILLCSSDMNVVPVQVCIAYGGGGGDVEPTYTRIAVKVT